LRNIGDYVENNREKYTVSSLQIFFFLRVFQDEGNYGGMISC